MILADGERRSWADQSRAGLFDARRELAVEVDSHHVIDQLNKVVSRLGAFGRDRFSDEACGRISASGAARARTSSHSIEIRSRKRKARPPCSSHVRGWQRHRRVTSKGQREISQVVPGIAGADPFRQRSDARARAARRERSRRNALGRALHRALAIAHTRALRSATAMGVPRRRPADRSQRIQVFPQLPINNGRPSPSVSSDSMIASARGSPRPGPRVAGCRNGPIGDGAFDGVVRNLAFEQQRAELAISCFAANRLPSQRSARNAIISALARCRCRVRASPRSRRAARRVPARTAIATPASAAQ